ncbi:hypothetical protein E5L23_06615 [Helicobacter pylori]|nr:hypothetical protein [Helicobacter pylori]WQY66289.1 hypothetical protein E5L61_06660 [Helicobacter pylori]WRC36789.1 hypothetical protein E5L23_06615 [Helicobacter pylori]
MKALKTFLKKSFILLLAIALNHLNAVAMIVDNPVSYGKCLFRHLL